MKQGQFFWYELMTTEVAAAADFYSQVVGWGVEKAPSSAMDYTLFTVEGRGVAGLMAIPDEMAGKAQPGWMVYVAVDDVDAAAARVEALGGAIRRPPFEVPGVIRLAVVADPQGVAFLVAKGLSDEPMPDLPPRTPGAAGWHELFTDDLDAGWAFYEAMFGWTKGEAFDMGPMGTYQLFSTGGEPVGGMMARPAQMPAPNWGVYFNTPDIDAAVDRVTTGGGKVLMGPVEVPGGDRIIQCADPQGAYFALTAPGR
jgi:hypothetical protein